MEIQEIIYLVIAVGTTVFSVYLYFRKPQEKSEVNDAVFDVKFQTLEKLVTNLRDNHIHTIESKLDLHIENQNKSELTMAKTIGRIETILEERLPRNK
jgi:flagellar basal body-associated protein FliL